jgi:hypothetical protein
LSLLLWPNCRLILRTQTNAVTDGVMRNLADDIEAEIVNTLNRIIFWSTEVDYEKR